MFEWNIGFNFIMKIKKDYINTFGEKEIYNLKNMIHQLNKDEYNHFVNCVKITQNDEMFPSIALIKYSLIGKEQPDLYENPNSIYRELRSLVIDIKNENIVLCPFKKFFNVNEIPETSMENVINNIKCAKTVEISNKLDGSMQQARWYNNQFFYTGSSAIDPKESQQLKDGLDIFNSSVNHQNMVKENPNLTFIFEYISPNNLIVVKYNETKLCLIGIRDVYTGRQFTYNEMVEYANKYNVPHTEVENRTFNEVINSIDNYHAEEKEGWVLYVDGNMYKMKCNEYREVHRILSFVSAPNIIMKSIADDYFDDIISKVPEAYRENIRKVADIVYKYVRDTQKAIDEWYEKMPKNDRKTFAIAVNKSVPNELKRFMFSKFNGQSFHILKKYENTQSPQYMKLSEIIGTNNYISFFNSFGIKNIDEE